MTDIITFHKLLSCSNLFLHIISNQKLDTEKAWERSWADSIYHFSTSISSTSLMKSPCEL